MLLQKALVLCSPTSLAPRRRGLFSLLFSGVWYPDKTDSSPSGTDYLTAPPSLAATRIYPVRGRDSPSADYSTNRSQEGAPGSWKDYPTNRQRSKETGAHKDDNGHPTYQLSAITAQHQPCTFSLNHKSSDDTVAYAIVFI